MSKGFLIFAKNTPNVDYVQQAYALALSIKYSQKTVKDVSIVTNDAVPKEYLSVFDKVIEIPWANETDSTYCAEDRWKHFHITPYDETIVLDSDMLLTGDISVWWEYCSSYDLKICSRIRNYKLDIVEKDTVHRRAFLDNGLTNPYIACHYFKKSDTAYTFYKVLEFVVNNWEWCYTKFAPVTYQNWLSLDLATAIAIEITGYYEAVNDVCSPLEFVHMKTPLQDWPVVPKSWQDVVHYVLNTKGELVVGNIVQPKLFHYVDKDFLSTSLIKRLTELAYAK